MTTEIMSAFKEATERWYNAGQEVQKQALLALPAVVREHYPTATAARLRTQWSDTGRLATDVTAVRLGDTWRDLYTDDEWREADVAFDAALSGEGLLDYYADIQGELETYEHEFVAAFVYDAAEHRAWGPFADDAAANAFIEVDKYLSSWAVVVPNLERYRACPLYPPTAYMQLPS